MSLSQRQINHLLLSRARDAMLGKRNAALEVLAAVMYARGYRAEELIVFHHEGEMSAVLVGDPPQAIVTDTTRIYLSARTPIYEGRLRWRRLWRKWIRPYAPPPISEVERIIR